MILNLDDLDLQTLKNQKIRLYYFGLGFIQLKLNETERLHFYSSKLPPITEDIHGHRYGFLSRILKGQLTNYYHEIYNIGEPNGTHWMVSESCNPEIKTPENNKTPCTEMLFDVMTYYPGESYVMTPHMYHRVEAQDCITYLIRTHKAGNFAQVIISQDKIPICPFSKKIPEPELWDIIAEMIKHDDN